MTKYRPICDLWILARPKLKDGMKFYGAYPAGFPERARVLVGAGINDPVLHVCGGQARNYLYDRGFGPHDKTLDLDPETNPDYLQNAMGQYPPYAGEGNDLTDWKAIIADPPYDEHHAEKYKPGARQLPRLSTILRNSLDVLVVGGRVGILGWFAPTCPKDAKFIACVGVFCGFNNRIRMFSVYENIGA